MMNFHNSQITRFQVLLLQYYTLVAHQLTNSAIFNLKAESKPVPRVLCLSTMVGLSELNAWSHVAAGEECLVGDSEEGSTPLHWKRSLFCILPRYLCGCAAQGLHADSSADGCAWQRQSTTHMVGAGMCVRTIPSIFCGWQSALLSSSLCHVFMLPQFTSLQPALLLLRPLLSSTSSQSLHSGLYKALLCSSESVVMPASWSMWEWLRSNGADLDLRCWSRVGLHGKEMDPPRYTGMKNGKFSILSHFDSYPKPQT